MVNESLATGDTVKAKVVDIKKFGAFVELENKEEGFIHISKISKNCKRVSDFFKPFGQELKENYPKTKMESRIISKMRI